MEMRSPQALPRSTPESPLENINAVPARLEEELSQHDSDQEGEKTPPPVASPVTTRRTARRLVVSSDEDKDEQNSTDPSEETPTPGDNPDAQRDDIPLNVNIGTIENSQFPNEKIGRSWTWFCPLY